MTDDTNDREQLFADIEAQWEEQKQQRRKAILRHKLPEKRDLLTALSAMTKQELDDIRYNLCVAGISSLKKAELAQALLPEIVAFSQKWFVTIGIEQYNILKSISHNNGVNTNLAEDDVRLDYMRCLGILFNGEKDGKQAWYMPDELLAVYDRLSRAAQYKKTISRNDEIMRLVGGILFYYGFLDYEQLHAAVMGYLDDGDNVAFADFMGIVINGACWQENVITAEQGMHYYTVMDADKLEIAQSERRDLAFAQLPYDKLYEAGEPNYVEATAAYKVLLEYLIQQFALPAGEAADIVGEINILIQNGEKTADIIDYIEGLGLLKEAAAAEQLLAYFLDYSNTLPQWLIKGHCPNEMQADGGTSAPFIPKTMKNNVVKFVPRSAAVGRNDPCPCGSGKKYKKCCLSKDLTGEQL